MQDDIRELIMALKHCTVMTGSCKGCPRYEDGAECLVDIKREAAEALEQYVSLVDAKDVIIDDLRAENKRLLEALELLESEQSASSDDTEIGILSNTNDRS